jgi:pSer/pThr/pTyr-binding forkhead associated (FHA) protein
MLAPDLELGVGERTRRITTVRMGEHKTTRAQVVAAKAPAPEGIHARLVFEDNLGRHEHEVVGIQTTIGRGGLAYPVDVRVSTSEDVSREHARIRRDEQTGQFFLIDLSSLGTTLNGREVPRGVATETALPPRARIGLADTVFMDFEQVQSARDMRA